MGKTDAENLDSDNHGSRCFLVVVAMTLTELAVWIICIFLCWCFESMPKVYERE